MGNSDIHCISIQLEEVARHISSLTVQRDCQVSDKVANVYEDILFDEIHHMQTLTLELTRLIAGGVEEPELYGVDEEMVADSAFAEGELTSVLGEKESEEDDEIIKEEE